MNNEPLLNIGIKAARKAGNFLIRSIDKIKNIKVLEKSTNDFVSIIDQETEKIIKDVVLNAYPEHIFLGEEFGISTNQSKSEFKWIVDPIDGTTNFLHGISHFCISIAVKKNDKTVASIIYNPYDNLLFTSYSGKGSYCNDRRIRVSARQNLMNCLIGTGLPFRENDKIDAYLETTKFLMLNTSGLRRSGSAALDLADVARGIIDGAWYYGLKIWDVAAGFHLIQEAGGIISNFEGENNFDQECNIVVGNPYIHAKLLSCINSQKIQYQWELRTVKKLRISKNDLSKQKIIASKVTKNPK